MIVLPVFIDNAATLPHRLRPPTRLLRYDAPALGLLALGLVGARRVYLLLRRGRGAAARLLLAGAPYLDPYLPLYYRAGGAGALRLLGGALYAGGLFPYS